jgi:hypothetical protein
MRLAMAIAAVAVLALVGQASARSSTSSSPSTKTACAPGYRPCLPVRADLDCDQIADRLKPVRVTGSDPYDLDRDGDGLGCEPSGWDDESRPGAGALSPWGVILRRPLTKEAKVIRVGNTVAVFGWSPRSAQGERFELCAAKPRGRCIKPVRRLNGKDQIFNTWTVRRADVYSGFLRVRLRVNGRGRAVDFVRVQ